MSESRTIEFLLGDERVSLAGLDPNTTLLQYLRGRSDRTGSKEGCAEGDCGACTVVLAEWLDGQVRHRAVNACIQLLPVVHGKQVLTVEDLAAADDDLHPVQQALVAQHGTQCGFCTPGFVMSLFALYQSGEQPDDLGLEDAIAGNLCRCTGYGPILAAGRQVLGDRAAPARDDAAALRSLAEAATPLHYEAAGRHHHAPRSLDALKALLTAHPEARLIAGLTDVGLWITKQGRRLERIIYLGEVSELRRLETRDGWIEIGAAVTYHQAHAVLARHWPDFGELVRRLGSRQIRNVATLGGNIANGSPIGDGPPALIALGARLILNGPEGRREIALEDFFIAYGQQDLRPSEFVEAIRVPLPRSGARFACYKLSKRFDQDISGLCGAFAIGIEDDRVRHCRIAFGGMAATPKRALLAEQALIDQPWSEPQVRLAMAAMAEDFTPINDMRASAAYRQLAARNLLWRCFLESSEGPPQTRVLAMREAAHG